MSQLPLGEELEQMSHYSVWLVPPDPLFSKSSKIIDGLAAEHSSSRFVPHVTLLGAIDEDVRETIDHVKALARKVAPYLISLREVAYSDEFFKCLFIRAELTPTVQSIYDEATQIFHVAQPARYDPHLSLLYGSFPEEIKREIVSQIGSKFTESFVANSLHVYETDPAKIINWRKIEEIGLRNHRA
jgi:2'-5' RNA ligase